MNLMKAARIVRKEMMSDQEKFTGHYSDDSHRKAVPGALQALVRMIMEGPIPMNQPKCNNTRSNAINTITQLNVFNSLKHSTSSGSYVRHNSDRETPVVIYLGLMIHLSTRSQDLVDKLHLLGMSISYR